MSRPDLAALADLLRPALQQCGVELVEVQWKGSGPGSLLRLVVDRPGGVGLDDCERASLTASAILDAYDPIETRYSLEVSSPGAERPIRTEEEWRAALGRRIHLRVRSGNAERVVEGRLIAAGGPTVEVEARTARGRPQPLTIATADILSARTAVDI
jgi:ribosome maturation factor RimP